MNVSSLEFNFEDSEFVTLLQCDQNVGVVFNFAETVNSRNLRLLQYTGKPNSGLLEQMHNFVALKQPYNPIQPFQ